MRSFLFSVILCSSALTQALADPAKFAPSGIPASCEAVAKVPRDATIAAPDLGARISTANCVAEARFQALKLAPDDASIAALNAAAKQSLEWLDAVIQQNDPAMTSIAKRARADLFGAMVVRMRNTIGPLTADSTGAQFVEHDQLHAALEPKLRPWLDQAH